MGEGRLESMGSRQCQVGKTVPGGRDGAGQVRRHRVGETAQYCGGTQGMVEVQARASSRA